MKTCVWTTDKETDDEKVCGEPTNQNVLIKWGHGFMHALPTCIQHILEALDAYPEEENKVHMYNRLYLESLVVMAVGVEDVMMVLCTQVIDKANRVYHEGVVS